MQILFLDVTAQRRNMVDLFALAQDFFLAGSPQLNIPLILDNILSFPNLMNKLWPTNSALMSIMAYHFLLLIQLYLLWCKWDELTEHF